MVSTLAKVGYDRYLRFVAPFLVIMFVWSICIFMADRRGVMG